MATPTNRRALRDFPIPFSCIRKTCKGETYQVPSNGVSANKTDINTPSTSPRIIALGDILMATSKGNRFSKSKGNDSCSNKPTSTPINPPTNPIVAI